MDGVNKRVRKYRHSATFYRKLSKKLKDNNEGRSVMNDNVNQLSPAAIEEAEKDKPENKVHGDLNDPEDDSSDEEQTINSQVSLSEQLRAWHFTHNIDHSALNDLLVILKPYNINLPSDSRTFLRTPRTLNIETMGSGQFWYNGIKNNLTAVFCDIDQSITLPLIFNVDGLPLFNASTTEFWPILFRIENMPKIKPMAIAIYCGQTKPPLKDFFTKFIIELNLILENGISINGHNIQVVVRYFVCDTPARNFVKGTVGFNSAHGCIKCTVIGEFDKKGRHMSFPRIECPLRTDESFRNKSDPDHHKDDSPLEKLPINMVEDFIVADSLHLFDLGIMRKCLYGWVNGSYNFRTKLSATEIKLLSDMLEDCNFRRPVEIHRSIRRLWCLKFWKGTEYRTFLLYLGPVLLKDFLCIEAYHNFLTLFCAVTIISCKTYLKYINIADILFKDYIEQYIDIYGIDSISSNVHNVAHVINDVKKFGILSQISVYPFENFLGHLKALIHSGNRPLAQIAKRIIEQNQMNSASNKSPLISFPYVKNENKTEKHQLLHCDKIFNEVYFSEDFMLCNNIKNKWFMTKDSDIVSMINCTYFDKKIHIYGCATKYKSDFFELPVKSSCLNVYKSDGSTTFPKLYSLNEIKCKLVSLKYKEEVVYIPLLHTLDQCV